MGPQQQSDTSNLPHNHWLLAFIAGGACKSHPERDQASRPRMAVPGFGEHSEISHFGRDTSASVK